MEAKVLVEPEVKFKKLVDTAVIPKYHTSGAAGVDLHSVVQIAIAPGARELIKTGLSVAIPAGWEGQVRARSGLALKHGIMVLNGPGTIDADYRGEIGVILHNTSESFVFEIKPGDRIAQLVFAPARQLNIREVTDLDATERGEGGFGSTGL